MATFDEEQAEMAAALSTPGVETEVDAADVAALVAKVAEEAGIDLEEVTDGDIPWMAGKKKLEYPNYNPVDVLLTKLEKWLLMQPEWAVILQAPRRTRRQAITLISKRLATIPNRYSNFGG